MDNIDISTITLSDRKIVAKKTAAKTKEYAPKHKQGELFLCGPIPWNWLTTASNANGKGSAVQVALAIWFLSGLNHKAATIKLTSKTLKQLGLERNAGYRGLNVLEESGLVTVMRKPGSSPIVTILESAAVDKNRESMNLANAEISICMPVHDATLIASPSLDILEQPIDQTQSIMAEANEIVLDSFRLNSEPETPPYPSQQLKELNIKIRGGKMPILARAKSISGQSSPDFPFLSVAEAEVCSR